MANHSLYSTKFKAKQKVAGLVQLNCWVPAEHRETIKALIQAYLIRLMDA